MEGLKELARPLDYKEIRLIESVRPESTLGKNTITFADIK